MRKAFLIVTIPGFLLLSGAALATGDGKALLYGGAGQGKVIFDGRLHASRGFVCADCHGEIFGTWKKALITMEDHSSDRACFTCHNGAAAFSDCESCHRQL